MMDGALLAVQMAEVFDSVWLVCCSIIIAFGVGLWLHATYIREDDDENR